MAPQPVVDALVEAVGKGLRLLVIGGTNSGKTTLLSAICNGIPKSARVLKIEDPEEIWLGPSPRRYARSAPRPARHGGHILYAVAAAWTMPCACRRAG